MAEHDDDDDRSERGFRFRQRLTGLLDPDAFVKGRDYVSELAQGTKSEIVRMVSSEVRSFLDHMDTVDLLQQVIAGLVIDVNAQIRFSFDEKNELKPTVTRKQTEVRSGRERKRDEPRGKATDPGKPPADDD